MLAGLNRFGPQRSSLRIPEKARLGEQRSCLLAASRSKRHKIRGQDEAGELRNTS